MSKNIQESVAELTTQHARHNLPFGKVVLVTGAWGSGKTTGVNLGIEEAKRTSDNIDSLYLSLLGISSIAEARLSLIEQLVHHEISSLSLWKRSGTLAVAMATATAILFAGYYTTEEGRSLIKDNEFQTALLFDNGPALAALLLVAFLAGYSPLLKRIVKYTPTILRRWGSSDEASPLLLLQATQRYKSKPDKQGTFKAQRRLVVFIDDVERADDSFSVPSLLGTLREIADESHALVFLGMNNNSPTPYPQKHSWLERHKEKIADVTITADPDPSWVAEAAFGRPEPSAPFLPEKIQKSIPFRVIKPLVRSLEIQNIRLVKRALELYKQCAELLETEKQKQKTPDLPETVLEKLASEALITTWLSFGERKQYEAVSEKDAFEWFDRININDLSVPGTDATTEMRFRHFLAQKIGSSYLWATMSSKKDESSISVRSLVRKAARVGAAEAFKPSAVAYLLALAPRGCSDLFSSPIVAIAYNLHFVPLLQDSSSATYCGISA